MNRKTFLASIAALLVVPKFLKAQPKQFEYPPKHIKWKEYQADVYRLTPSQFYEKYWTVNGHDPMELSEEKKRDLDKNTFVSKNGNTFYDKKAFHSTRIGEYDFHFLEGLSDPIVELRGKRIQLPEWLKYEDIKHLHG